MKKKKSVGKIILHIFLIAISIGYVIPILLMINISFTDEVAISEFGYQLIPSKWSVDAYKMVFENMEQVIDSYKKRGHAIALNAISGGGTAGVLDSMLIDGCVIDGVRGNAIQLYGTTGNITVKNTKINSWGINNGAYTVNGTVKDANSAAIRGDFPDGGERSLTISNVYFGMDEDTVTDSLHKINHVNVGSFSGNTDGTRNAGTY